VASQVVSGRQAYQRIVRRNCIHPSKLRDQIICVYRSSAHGPVRIEARDRSSRRHTQIPVDLSGRVGSLCPLVTVVSPNTAKLCADPAISAADAKGEQKQRGPGRHYEQNQSSWTSFLDTTRSAELGEVGTGTDATSAPGTDSLNQSPDTPPISTTSAAKLPVRRSGAMRDPSRSRDQREARPAHPNPAVLL